jgi:methylthioribose-1-phosphate isomerase
MPAPDAHPDASAAGDAELVPDGTALDVGRRTFFRRVAGDLVDTAASLTSAANVARGAVAAAAQELGSDASASAPMDRRERRATTPGGRSMEWLAREHLAGVAPWAWDGESLLVLDLRRLPGSVAAFPVRGAPEAARAVRERVVIGPSAAAVAGWGMALTAEAAIGRGAAASSPLVVGAGRSLSLADESSFVLQRTLAELTDAMTADAAPRATADGIAKRLAADHGRLNDAATQLFARLGTQAPLIHGPCGALWGAGVALIPSSIGMAWVTEGRPWLDGARITAWELDRGGVPVTVIPDAAAPGAVIGGRFDAVICAAERMAADGSALLPVGALGLAAAAARAAVPFLVVAASWSFDPDAPEGDALIAPAAPPEAVARIAGSRIVPHGVAVDTTRSEVVPPDLIAHVVTVPAAATWARQ